MLCIDLSLNKQQHRLKECVDSVILRAYLPLHVCLILSLPNSALMLHNVLVTSAKSPAVITLFSQVNS